MHCSARYFNVFSGGSNLSSVVSLAARLRASLLLAVLCATPAAARAEWSVDQSGDCVLESGETSLFDGYQDTTVKLSISDTGLLVITESNIDPGFDDMGLAVDGGGFLPADSVVDERHVLFSKDSDAIMEKFMRGRKVNVYLRFWPSYPVTQRYEVAFSLIGFTRAYRDYKQCRGKAPA